MIGKTWSREVEIDSVPVLSDLSHSKFGDELTCAYARDATNYAIEEFVIA